MRVEEGSSSHNFPKAHRKFSENVPESFFQTCPSNPKAIRVGEGSRLGLCTPFGNLRDFQDFGRKSFNERLKLFSNTPVPETNTFQLKKLKSSPLRAIRNRFGSDLNLQSKLELPASGEYISLMYSHLLSDYEKQEITEYEEVFFIGDYIKKNHGKLEEEDGSYKASPGDQIAFRYEIQELLGKGSFGKVFKCFDHKRKMPVALKVLNKTSRMKILAESETKALRILNENDEEDSKCIVRMLLFFEYRGHICISFELLSQSLFSFLRFSSPGGLDMQVIKRISSQILIGLRHIHSQGIIHRDLKLENVLLKQPNKTLIKIIDFGSSCLFPSPFYSYVQSRYYRAPEVILGCGHTNKIDMWSFGCIVGELITGRSLFTGKNQEDQLLKIALIIGSPPSSLLEKSRKKYPILEKYVENSRHAGKLEFLIGDDDPHLVKFLEGCLNWDPDNRLSADQALSHPWLKIKAKNKE
jgi:dual specificity tyrosine-phosphorylation-regulated kinase 2/3/4